MRVWLLMSTAQYWHQAQRHVHHVLLQASVTHQKSHGSVITLASVRTVVYACDHQFVERVNADDHVDHDVVVQLVVKVVD